SAAIYSNGAHGKLPSKHRRSEGVRGHHQSEVGLRVEARVHVRGEIDRNPAGLELAGGGDIGPGRHAGVIVDGGERPSRLLGTRRKAAEKAGKPEAHAAFVGKRSLRNEGARGGEDCDPSTTFPRQAPAAICLSDSRHVAPGRLWDAKALSSQATVTDGKMLRPRVATCRASAAPAKRP